MRFFFDTEGGTERFHDELGMELPNLEYVRATARVALIELARDEAAKGAVPELRMLVRNERDDVVLKVLLHLEVEEPKPRIIF